MIDIFHLNIENELKGLGGEEKKKKEKQLLKQNGMAMKELNELTEDNLIVKLLKENRNSVKTAIEEASLAGLADFLHITTSIFKVLFREIGEE